MKSECESEVITKERTNNGLRKTWFYPANGVCWVISEAINKPFSAAWTPWIALVIIIYAKKPTPPPPPQRDHVDATFRISYGTFLLEAKSLYGRPFNRFFHTEIDHVDAAFRISYGTFLLEAKSLYGRPFNRFFHTEIDHVDAAFVFLMGHFYLKPNLFTVAHLIGFFIQRLFALIKKISLLAKDHHGICRKSSWKIAISRQTFLIIRSIVSSCSFLTQFSQSSNGLLAASFMSGSLPSRIKVPVGWWIRPLITLEKEPWNKWGWEIYRKNWKINFFFL